MGAILHTTSGEPITYIEHEQVVRPLQQEV